MPIAAWSAKPVARAMAPLVERPDLVARQGEHARDRRRSAGSGSRAASGSRRRRARRSAAYSGSARTSSIWAGSAVSATRPTSVSRPAGIGCARSYASRLGRSAGRRRDVEGAVVREVGDAVVGFAQARRPRRPPHRARLCSSNAEPAHDPQHLVERHLLFDASRARGRAAASGRATPRSGPAGSPGRRSSAGSRRRPSGCSGRRCRARRRRR